MNSQQNQTMTVGAQPYTLQALHQCMDVLRAWIDQPETDQALDAARARAVRAAAAAATVLGTVPAADDREGEAAFGHPGDAVEALRSCAFALAGWLGEVTSTAEYDIAFDRVLVAIDRAERVLADAEAAPA